MKTEEKKAQNAIKDFGRHLKNLRVTRNMTQEGLAYAAGLTFSQISRMERGKINAGILNVFLIANALNIHPRDLFDFDLEPENSASTSEE